MPNTTSTSAGLPSSVVRALPAMVRPSSGHLRVVVVPERLLPVCVTRSGRDRNPRRRSSWGPREEALEPNEERQVTLRFDDATKHRGHRIDAAGRDPAEELPVHPNDAVGLRVAIGDTNRTSPDGHEPVVGATRVLEIEAQRPSGRCQQRLSLGQSVEEPSDRFRHSIPLCSDARRPGPLRLSNASGAVGPSPRQHENAPPRVAWSPASIRAIRGVHPVRAMRGRGARGSM